jgi:CheY-like chemotaxis protein
VARRDCVLFGNGVEDELDRGKREGSFLDTNVSAKWLFALLAHAGTMPAYQTNRSLVRTLTSEPVPTSPENFPTHPYFIYAEDEAGAVVLMRAALRKLNAEDCLVHTPDGDALICCLRDAIIGRCLPAFVLLDLCMPKAGGFESLRWIGAMPELKGVPVVILSSSPLAQDVELAVALGAASYIVKPGSYQELCGIIEDLLVRFDVAQRKDRPGS